MQHCPNCGGGELKIIAAILERPVIEKILTHLGLDPQPPPRGRARQAGQDTATGTTLFNADGRQVPVLPAMPIPEPGTWALMLGGLVAMGWTVRCCSALRLES